MIKPRAVVFIFLSYFYLIFICIFLFVHTFSTPVKSFSISSNELIDMPAFKCQCIPYKEAAMLDAAVVLAEYIEKLCSVNREN